MKKTVVLMAAMLVTTFAFAQKVKESEVPETIKSAFQKQHPNAKEVKWEKENGNYEAEFEMGETESSVLYNTDGNLLETEVEITAADLPKKASEYVQAHYKDQKMKEVAKISDAKGIVTYEAEIQGMDLIFDNAGKFIKEVKE